MITHTVELILHHPFSCIHAGENVWHCDAVDCVKKHWEHSALWAHHTCKHSWIHCTDLIFKLVEWWFYQICCGYKIRILKEQSDSLNILSDRKNMWMRAALFGTWLYWYTLVLYCFSKNNELWSMCKAPQPHTCRCSPDFSPNLIIQVQFCTMFVRLTQWLVFFLSHVNEWQTMNMLIWPHPHLSPQAVSSNPATLSLICSKCKDQTEMK